MTRRRHWLVAFHFRSVVPSWARAMLVFTLVRFSEASFLTLPTYTTLTDLTEQRERGTDGSDDDL